MRSLMVGGAYLWKSFIYIIFRKAYTSIYFRTVKSVRIVIGCVFSGKSMLISNKLIFGFFCSGVEKRQVDLNVEDISVWEKLKWNTSHTAVRLSTGVYQKREKCQLDINKFLFFRVHIRIALTSLEKFLSTYLTKKA